MPRQRQLGIRECYEILHLQKGADLQAVKTAYRKRAFELHPDLNPGDAEASRQFQLLNEAYVALSAILKPQEEARQKKATGEASGKRTQTASGDNEKTHASGEREQTRAQAAYAEQDVLRDLLNDPFARRVFEDIYSELAKKQQTPPPPPPPREEPRQHTQPKPEPKPQPTQTPKPAKPLHMWERGQDKGVKGAVKDWLRKQIDDEQTIKMPAAGLAPGRKVRFQIRKGFSDETTSVEVTLPKDFVIGKPVRLRGLGKRVGPWTGDLYLTINTE